MSQKWAPRKHDNIVPTTKIIDSDGYLSPMATEVRPTVIMEMMEPEVEISMVESAEIEAPPRQAAAKPQASDSPSNNRSMSQATSELTASIYGTRSTNATRERSSPRTIKKVANGIGFLVQSLMPGV